MRRAWSSPARSTARLTGRFEKFGGTHHGYFLPSEGASDFALAMFSIPSLAAYETYRQRSKEDAACIAAFRYAEETRCIVSYERSFFRPVFE
ncbi:NIPSNAP family protein [Burkholderia ubonensis]|uniref:NIPSNAP family protein n=1 Tax=Burkholderia ubonensis TaxID=101571 RepID=UPI00075BAC39|nr:NIPSNAP family protein [Burkholderia ubonensis]AOK62857.1 NIPSNAP family containing protein [Burkholderia ubonensis]KVS45300.1 NIPSNAP family containing protein [Burkholderia ubonensis]KVS50605.1 NIPSNAP family containing protein [Burkholderia ubonensis]KVS84562.1 NIPSNAP family containing protein [Burkholderia ubonensis]KVS84725.1 NIPSNAP family containing protein [Burkholderia ubonensis]